jgi:nucleoside-diphosphate-sugar epimerase
MTKQRHYLVTGGTGFIGREVVAELLALGQKVTVVARCQASVEKLEWFEKISFIEADVYDLSEDFFSHNLSTPIDAVLHLAWSCLPNYSSIDNFEVDLVGSIKFLGTAVQAGIKQITVTGTCLEYGMKSGPLHPDTPLAPILPYPASKVALWSYLQNLASQFSDLSVQWIRLFYIWGATQSSRTLYGQLRDAVDRKDRVFNMSGGEQVRDYLPVGDVARCIADYAQNPNLIGAYNCCSGLPISVRQFVEQRLRELGSDMKLNLGYYPYSDYEPFAFWGSNDNQKSRFK